MLDEADLEGCVESLYRRASLDDDTVCRPTKLARLLLGPESVFRAPNLRFTGSLSWLDGEPVIAVRKGLTVAREQHVVGHELGHWILTVEGVPRGEQREDWCDYIGAGIIARRRPFARVASHDYQQLALDFGTTETLIALRVGEVLHEPVAVVAPHAVRARGDGWRDESTIRRWTKATPTGLVKVRLTDEPKRVALHS